MIEVLPTRKLDGTTNAPNSKPGLQRALLLGLLAEGRTRIRNFNGCAEAETLLRAICQLGAGVQRDGQDLLIDGVNGMPLCPDDPVDCRESGFALRTLLLICSLCKGESQLVGGPGLATRPLSELIEAVREQGVDISVQRSAAGLHISVGGGGLPGGMVDIGTNATSQFLTAFLVAAPFSRAPTELRFHGANVSHYNNMTIDMLRDFGAQIADTRSRGVRVVPSGLRARRVVIGPDATAVFYFIAAAALLPSRLMLHGSWTRLDPLMRRTLATASQMGVRTHISGDNLAIESGEAPGEHIHISAEHIPTLVPALAAASAGLPAGITLSGGRHLVFHKTSRLKLVLDELARLGYRLTPFPEVGTVDGFTGAPRQRSQDEPLCHSFGDHRLFMALFVAALAHSQPVIVDGEESITNAYPRFLDDFTAIGARFRFISPSRYAARLRQSPAAACPR